jgi:hypothetical protein
MAAHGLPPEQLAAELDRKLAHVREPRMRERLLAEQLGALPAAEVYALLAHVLRRRPGGSGQSPDLLCAGLHAFVAAAGKPCAELQAWAEAEGDDLVLGLLRARDPRDASDDPTQNAHLDLREVALGRRRSLARGRDPILLEKLARDPDPVVIANLLSNPRTTENDVVRIAALRPVAASTLAEIARAERWGRQPRVRVALARNPCCPIELALSQLHALPRAELREIAGDPGIDAVLRAHAEHELGRRAG